jgi:hypothetical protein
LHNADAGGGDSGEALTIFVEGEEAAVEAVEIGGKHGQWLLQVNAETESAVVGIADIDSAVQTSSGRRSGRSAVEKWFVGQRAG